MIGWDWGDVPPWLALIIALVVAMAFVAGRLDDLLPFVVGRLYVVLTKSTASTVLPAASEGPVSVRPTNYSEAPVFGLAIALGSSGSSSPVLASP